MKIITYSRFLKVQMQFLFFNLDQYCTWIIDVGCMLLLINPTSCFEGVLSTLCEQFFDILNSTKTGFVTREHLISRGTL